jgi:hypothetical protein
MQSFETASMDPNEERVAWEGLASSCASPLRRLGAFALLGFFLWVTATTMLVLFYNVLGEPVIPGGGVAVPAPAFYAVMAGSVVVVVVGYGAWLFRSLRSFETFSAILRRGGIDPRRPGLRGLGVYSDEQLLALRSRYALTNDEGTRERLHGMFGFHEDDSFSLGPLSVLPGTFEMASLRVEWEADRILNASLPTPEVTWWLEGRHGLLPRQPNETRRLVYALRYTADSVRELKRRYGYRTDRWHATVPEGKLWDAVRDLESARRLQLVLNRKTRG